MRLVIEHADHGIIEYDESFWTGKKSLYINGAPLQKVSKKVFVTPAGERMTVEGNYLTGSYISSGTDRIQLAPAVKWYEVVLSLLPFVFILIWGNSVSLCEIVPVIGGGIGGFISGVMSVTNLFLIKSVKPVWLKIFITAGMFAGTFLVCFLMASVFISLLA